MNLIEISDPARPDSGITHNNASIVSHDVYLYDEATMEVLNYPGIIVKVVWLECDPLSPQIHPGIDDACPDEAVPLEIYCLNVDELTMDTYFVAKLSSVLSLSSLKKSFLIAWILSSSKTAAFSSSKSFVASSSSESL